MDVFNFAKTVPDWMDRSFFEKVVQEMEKDSEANVENFDVLAGSNPGDNFASSIYRAKIEFKSKFTRNETKSISVIIKTEIINGIECMQDFVKDSPMFRNEIEMYDKVLPEIQALWQSVGDKDFLCPKLIYYTNDPASTIVLEDLSIFGFDVITKPVEDFEVSKQIARRLAKFHAASFFLHHEKKLDYNDFKMHFFQNPVMSEMMFVQGLEAFIDVAKEWKGFEKYIPKLERFAKHCLIRGSATYTPNRTEIGYNVLNHADFHLKNMLFRKNADGDIDDFYMIDFQICIHASPAIDILYALYFFVSAENRQTRRNEFVSTYHHQFVESLKKFGYSKPPPTLIDLKVELLRNGNLEVLIAICMAVFFFVDLTTMTAEDMDMGEGTKRAKRRMYNTPGIKEMIQNELPRFVQYGFI